MRRRAIAAVLGAVLLAALASSTAQQGHYQLASHSSAASATAPVWVVDSHGTVYPVGSSRAFGSVKDPSGTVVGIAATPDEGGYWVATSNGNVYAFGDAGKVRSLADILAASHRSLQHPIVGIAAAGQSGYFLVASDGGVFALGAAKFHGSVPQVVHKPLTKPVVGIAATPGGGGYWVAAADGGLYRFGNARYFGSVPASLHGGKLNGPIVAIASPPGGGGYWMGAADGGIFSYGAARFFGSLPYYKPAVAASGPARQGPLTGLVTAPTGSGYWGVISSGFIYGFGDAARSTRQLTVAPAYPVVGIAS